MRIHRTKPTRSFTAVTNALVRDRGISWCASGVLMYLLSLPNNARADIRSLAGQCKEGRARITDALHDLEKAGYLRRVLVKNKKSGELSTVYEVFDHPCTDRVTAEPAEPAQNGQNLASGDRDRDDTGSLPAGEKTEEQKPPSRPLPKLTVPERLRPATELLLSLRAPDAPVRMPGLPGPVAPLGPCHACTPPPPPPETSRRPAGAGRWPGKP
ncbi:hypothetical protein [Streptomyces niveus]|uniref:hypothetical protein n=1 Tax=Streptomyces niveus TaxID=193462 RepID=UPI003681C471